MGLTTDPNDDCIKVIRPDGMQECYLILPESERKKGFVRPVRQAYIHLKCGAHTRMGLAIAETYARNPKFYGGTYCVNCGTHFNLRSLDFEDSTAHLQMRDGKPVLAWHFAWLDERDGEPDGSYVGE
jgi:hypothetical protein